MSDTKPPSPDETPGSVLGRIADEFADRLSRGENPDPQEYALRYPALADAIVDLLSPATVGPTAGGWPSFRAPLPPLPPVDPTADLPHVPGYEVIERIGKGGMGVVYKARQVALDRVVALKMIRSRGPADEEEIARFRAEALAVARLSHPHIVGIYEVGETAGGPFMAMEYCPGGSLADLLRDGPLPPDEAARRAAVLASAVDAAHRAGIVHRDLKPHNVLLATLREPQRTQDRGQKTERATPKTQPDPRQQRPSAVLNPPSSVPPGDGMKVADFGLARRIEGDSTLTQTGAIVGTPGYMAPEQARGEKSVGPPADIWALGAILYECLTGRPPFSGAGVIETLEQVRNSDPVPPRQLRPNVPRDLETICLACLHKEPARRYASAQELADDLSRFLRGEAVHARQTPAWERAVKWVRRRPAVAALSALLVGGGVAALVVMTLLWRDAVRARDEARDLAVDESIAREAEGKAKDEARRRERLEIAAREQAQKSEADAQSALLLRHLALAQERWHAGALLDAEQLLNRCPVRLRGWEWNLLQARFRQADDAVVDQDIVSPHGLAFHPGGRRLAWVAGSRLHVWEVNPRRKLWEQASNRYDLQSVVWSHDGRHLFTGSTTSEGVEVWDAQTGRGVRTLPGRAPLALSPDSLKLLACGRTGEPMLVDTATGKGQPLPGGGKRVCVVAFAPTGESVSTGSLDGVVHLWSIRPPAATAAALVGVAGNPLSALTSLAASSAVPRHALSRTYQGQIRALAFSPDGRQLALGHKVNLVRCLDVRTGKENPPVRQHRSMVESIAWRPDGSQLAVAGHDGLVYLWPDGVEGEVRRLAGHTGIVFTVAFSPDGNHLATAGLDGTVRLWPADSAPGAIALPTRRDAIQGIAFGGGLLAVAGAEGDVLLYEHPTRRLRRRISIGQGVYRLALGPKAKWVATSGRLGGLFVHSPQGERLHDLTLPGTLVMALAAAPDGKTFAACSSSGAVSTYDPEAGVEVRRWRLPRPPKSTLPRFVQAMVYDHSGKELAVAAMDGEIHIHDPRSGKHLRTLGFLGSQIILCAALSPDGTALATGGTNTQGDGEVQVRDFRTGKLLQTVTGAAGKVFALAYAPDGKRIATASGDGMIQLWDAREGTELLRLPGHAGSAYALEFSPDGVTLATGGLDGRTLLWEAPPVMEKLILRHQRPAAAAAFDQSGGRILVTQYDGTLVVWDAESGRLVRRVVGTASAPGLFSLTVSPGGGWLAAGDSAGNVQLHPPGMDAAPKLLKGHKGVVTALASDDRGNLASGGEDAIIYLWDTKSGKNRALTGHKAVVNALAYAPGGRLLSCSPDGTVRLWDVEGGKPAGALEVPASPAEALAVGGGLAAGACEGGEVVIWDLSTGKVRSRLREHKGRVRAVAFSPDGKLLATAGADRVVLVWDVASGKRVARWAGHLADVKSLQFSRDGRAVLSAGLDRTARLWLLPEALVPRR